MSKSLRAVVLGGAALSLLVLAGPASAHVTIGPNTAPKGGSDVELTFRVPNEEASANTTQLEVDFPTDHPITGVLPEPTPGWTAAVTNFTLPTPITTDDGTITQVVSKIVWTGGQIPPAQYQGFHVMLSGLPDSTDSLTFKALQTYSNGDIVRWIDVPQAGQPAPDHPAPVLTLTAAAAAGSSTPTAASSSAAAAPAAAAVSKSGSDGTARTLGIVGIIIGAAGLLVGAVGMSAARRKAAGPTP
jgi:uncharacterized protein YcnI